MTDTTVRPEDARAADLATVQAFRLLPEGTAVRFTTRHLFGLGRVAGSVRPVSGRMVADAASGALLSLEAELDMAAFASGSTARDRVVASARMLDSAAHPRAQYRSSAAERTASGWLVRGVLTVKGVEAPVDLHVDDLDPATATEAHATAVVDRFAYGVAFPTAMGSRTLSVDVVARAERVVR